MKKVISSTDLKEKIDEALEILCPPVKCTLGPKGNNVIIDHSNFSPFITNDGVTIASNIESEDKCVNTILEFIKEASIKTNELVGDGTTTTIVLLEAIYKEGLKYTDNISPIILKTMLDEALIEIEKEIWSISKKPNNKDLLNIACISGGSDIIGKIISEVYDKVKNKDAIEIITSDNKETSIDYKHGYILDTTLVSPYYFKDTNEINLKNTKILLVDNYLESLDNISNIINYIISNKNELLIVADDYSESFINEVMDLYINENIKIYLAKNPEYGDNKYSILKDIKALSNSKILENTMLDSPNYLGNITNVTINKERMIIAFEKSKKTEDRLIEIKNEDNEKFRNRRIAMFTSGLCTIKIGSQTTTETRELKMRFDDALCATNEASKGILPGCGITLLKLSDNLEIKNEAYQILKNALKVPFKQILINSGLNPEEIYNIIKESNYTKIFNVKTNEYENISNTSVIDPTNVIINSLKNACSIASMLLSTSSLVINEYQNNINKVNDYTEL